MTPEEIKELLDLIRAQLGWQVNEADGGYTAQGEGAPEGVVGIGELVQAAEAVIGVGAEALGVPEGYSRVYKGTDSMGQPQWQYLRKVEEEAPEYWSSLEEVATAANEFYLATGIPVRPSLKGPNQYALEEFPPAEAPEEPEGYATIQEAERATGQLNTRGYNYEPYYDARTGRYNIREAQVPQEQAPQGYYSSPEEARMAGQQAGGNYDVIPLGPGQWGLARAAAAQPQGYWPSQEAALAAGEQAGGGYGAAPLGPGQWGLRDIPEETRLNLQQQMAQAIEQGDTATAQAIFDFLYQPDPYEQAQMGYQQGQLQLGAGQLQLGQAAEQRARLGQAMDIAQAPGDWWTYMSRVRGAPGTAPYQRAYEDVYAGMPQIPQMPQFMPSEADLAGGNPIMGVVEGAGAVVPEVVPGEAAQPTLAERAAQLIQPRLATKPPELTGPPLGRGWGRTPEEMELERDIAKFGPKAPTIPPKSTKWSMQNVAGARAYLPPGG